MTTTLDRPPSLVSPSWPILPIPSGRDSEQGDAPRGPFARLVGLMRGNDRLFNELRRLRDQLDQARAYQARPDAHPFLAQAQIDRLRGKRSGLLAQLRANRVAARMFLSPAARRPVASA